MIWRRSKLGDTLEELADKVELDPMVTSVWAKAVNGSYGFEYSVPNVWIIGSLLEGRREEGILRHFDWLINWGDEIGEAFTFTEDKHVVRVGAIQGIVPAIRAYAGDIWAFSLFSHGSRGVVGQHPRRRGRVPGGAISQNDILAAIDGNGFKISVAYLMQCYSRVDGFGEAWKSRTVRGARTYQGINCAGVDLGMLRPQAPRQRDNRRPRGPRHRGQ